MISNGEEGKLLGQTWTLLDSERSIGQWQKDLDQHYCSHSCWQNWKQCTYTCMNKSIRECSHLTDKKMDRTQKRQCQCLAVQYHRRWGSSRTGRYSGDKRQQMVCTATERRWPAHWQCFGSSIHNGSEKERFIWWQYHSTYVKPNCVDTCIEKVVNTAFWDEAPFIKHDQTVDGDAAACHSKS